MRFSDITQAHRVIQPGLNVSGSARRRAIDIADTNRQRFDSALKRRPHRCTNHAELDFRSRMHADYRIDAKNERTDIQARAASVRRYIRRIGRN